MGEISTIGLDIAKSVFQVHGIDVAGAVVIRKRVSRAKVLEPFANHLTKPPFSIGLIADGAGKGTEEDPGVIGGILQILACSVEDEVETAMFNVSPNGIRTCLRALLAGSDLTFTITDYETDPPVKLRLRLPNSREFSQLYDRVQRGM